MSDDILKTGSFNILSGRGLQPIERRGFTLVETLVVVAIFSVLTALGVAGVANMQEAGRRVREISSSRTLVAAYLSYANDHGGRLMPGYQYGAESITDPKGTEISGEEVYRYPWRLAEYIEWNVEGIYLINRTRKEVAGLDPGSTMYRYTVALAPVMGLNAYCVGGNYSASGLLCPEDVATRLVQIPRPAKTLAFVSTRYKAAANTEAMEGYFYARPPVLGPFQWNSGAYDPAVASSQFGFVDFRHNKKAVCAFIDGHSALLGIDELRDMRHWAPKAETADYNLQIY